MQHLHFVTVSNTVPAVTEYSLELSAILRDAGIPSTHWVPFMDTDRSRSTFEAHQQVDPDVQGSELLGRSLLPIDFPQLQQFGLSLGEGFIVLSATISTELPDIIACLRMRLGRKIILILHGVQDWKEDDHIRLCFQLAHLVILPSFTDMAIAQQRNLMSGDVFAIPLNDNYPAVFINAVQTSQRLQAPLVSVVMTCYNQPEYIVQALDSLKAQTMESWECVIVDDASKDNSVEVVKPYLDDSRFSLICLENNAGSAGARNAGIERTHALSDYVMIFDGDDIIEPEHLETLITHMGVDLTIVGSYGQLTFIDKDGKEVKNPRNSLVRVPPGNRLTGRMMAVSCLIYPPTGALFRKWAVVAAGPFNTWLRQSDDWDWLTRVCLHGDMLFTPKKVVKYRLHGSSLQQGEKFAMKAKMIMERRCGHFIQAATRSKRSYSNYESFRYSLSELQTELLPVSLDHRVGVIVVSKGDRPLKPVLDCLKKQTFNNFECIIVTSKDEGKTDPVKPFLRDKRFRRTLHPGKSLAAAKNHGASLLSDKVTHMIFLEPDDLLIVDAFTVLLSLLDKHKTAPAASARYVEDAKDFPGTMDWQTPDVFNVANPILANGSVMMRQQVWLSAGPFDESLRFFSEWALWSRLSRLAPLAHLRFPLVEAPAPTVKMRQSLEKETRKLGPALVEAVKHSYKTGEYLGYHYDPFLRNRVRLPCPDAGTDNVICVAAGKGQGPHLTALLGSLLRHGNISDALRVVFNVGEDPEIEEIAELWGARTVPVEPLADPNLWGKTILYSAASLLQAGRILCLDVDMLVLGDLSGLFRGLDSCAPDCLFVVPEAQAEANLLRSWGYLYGADDDTAYRLGLGDSLGESKLTPNEGTMLGSCRAFLSVEKEMRAVFTGHWDLLDTGPNRRQGLLGVTLARLGNGVSLSENLNTQLHVHRAHVFLSEDNPRNVTAFHHNNPVKILHYSGTNKELHPEFQGFYRGLTPETAIERIEQKEEDGDAASV